MVTDARKVIRTILRQITPPLLVDLVRRPKREQALRFVGDYPSWDEASAAAGQCYTDPGILERVRAGALKAKRGEVAFERDSVTFHTRELRWPLLACVYRAALNLPGGKFHVLDFGGSLGSTYYQHRAELSDISGLQWSIVEQSHFVECGRREFEDDVLRFFHCVQDAARHAAIDLALFSGSVQYIPDSYEILEEVASLGVPYLLFDRTPVSDGDLDKITIQHVNEPIYIAQYPHRTFAKRALLNRISSLNYKTLCEFGEIGTNIGFFCQRL